MRVAIVSDTDTGDSQCSTIEGGREEYPVADALYRDKNHAPGDRKDHLISLGNISDASIVSCHEAYEWAKFFFMQNKNDGIILLRRGNGIFKIDITKS